MHVTLSAITLIMLSACGGNGGQAGPAAAPPAPTAFTQTDLAPGTGTQAGTGARVTVKYTGWIYDASKPDNRGAKFDSTDDHEPLTFTLGRGEVSPGWDQGVNGMHVGGKRRLIIPPNLGYGAEGGGPIPPNAGLVFDVELVDAK
jgi:FKBP-type peptidyl-prolyl cis-trans isomerase FkpA